MVSPVNLQEWIVRPELLNKETLYELRNLLARYPCFQTARLLYLKNLYLLHDPSFGEELRKAALYVADRRMLFYLIEGDRFVIRSAEKKETQLVEAEPGLDRTLSLIDAFLSTIPEDPLQAVQVDCASDYAAYLLKMEPETGEDGAAPRMAGQNLIDRFIEQERTEVLLRIAAPPGEENEYPEPECAGVEEEEEDESCFTETLAKIYVKQKKYSKALEIIKKLSLKYPKKNAYFADQIRFLEKLIINTQTK